MSSETQDGSRKGSDAGGDRKDRHSQGPWEFGTLSWQTSTHPRVWRAAVVTRSRIPDSGLSPGLIELVAHGNDQAEAIGNAHLMAAAPDLLEACRTVVASCRCKGAGTYEGDCRLCGDSTFDHVCDYPRYTCRNAGCIAARAAIAKAEGGAA